MSGVTLRDYKLEAMKKMHNGCILCGGVGSGKSRTGLAYYYTLCGGEVNSKEYVKMKNPIPDLYIITTAKKRDSSEWEDELIPFRMNMDQSLTIYKIKIVIDSWNNIKKYRNVSNAFFIFDEQRVVGYGAWAQAFFDITKKNQWILLSATPGDTWMDYMSVFIANGFYKNKTDFVNRHVVYDYRVQFPRVSRYTEINRLIRLRNKILVKMDFERETVPHHIDVYCDYDRETYRLLGRQRWNPKTQEPIKTASELCLLWREIVNKDPSRPKAVLKIFNEHPKVIIFYNFDYELEILRHIPYGPDVVISEWNGHKHEDIPVNESKWVYLVQYNAGCEGWNCISTNTIIFYSENYSYKMMAQASGRIDRMNTTFINLYYYHLKSHAPIDLAIGRALKQKKNFNAGKFVK